MVSAIKNISSQLLVRQKDDGFGFIKGLFLALVWQVYKRLIGLPVIINTYRKTSFILRPSCITSSRFVYEKTPDKREIEILAAFAGNNVMFVDVGANVGLYSVLLCRDFDEAILFEPNPVAATMLMKNIAINEKLDKYKIYEAAVGAKNGQVSFPVLDSPLPTAKISSDASEVTIERKLICLDDILLGSRQIVIKIDAEGFDAEVIMGLTRCLSESKVRICLFECHTLEILKKVYDFLYKNNKLSYSIYDETRLIDTLDDFSQKMNRDIFIVRNDIVDNYLKLIDTTR